MDVQKVGDLEPLVMLGSSPCFLLKVACRFRGSQIIVLGTCASSKIPLPKMSIHSLPHLTDTQRKLSIRSEMNKHSPLPHHSTNPSNKPPFHYSPSRRPVSHPRPRSLPILPAYTKNEPTVVIRRLYGNTSPLDYPDKRFPHPHPHPHPHPYPLFPS
ncbi:uncharacterized protein RAG0_09006 [Rhynchosporium agropyri]|uniref:Uncharacterized protein n=1 Tax=Rhynchosporium agropyri TaxID=914238 RepID=A0A1E1KT79_9HELO|nr:uncharacterized protein RAG0_09006 [Rhynchosporium agropyri]